MGDSWENDYVLLHNEINEDSNHYNKKIRQQELLEKINRFSLINVNASKFLYIHFKLMYNLDKYPAIVNELSEMLLFTTEKRILIDVHSIIARLTLYTTDKSVNYLHRQKALDLSIATNNIIKIASTYVNWIFASTEIIDLPTANEKLNDLEELLSVHSFLKEHNIIYNHYLAHKAKFTLRQASTSKYNDRRKLIEQGCNTYSQLLESLTNNHYRVNLTLEWVHELLKLMANGYYEKYEKIESLLIETTKNYHLSDCIACQGNLHYLKSLFNVTNSTRIFNINKVKSLQLLKESNSEVKKSIKLLSDIEHPKLKESVTLKKKINFIMKDINQHQKIFLSHSSKDKSLVIEFEETLSLLGFETWYDIKEMSAGKVLEHSLYEGIKTSCAVIFFVTDNFKDFNYLKTEIEYAVHEKRKKELKKQKFEIIVLNFLGSKKVKLPGLLQKYVFKSPKNQLEALREILKSLPIRVGTITFKDKQ